MSVLAQPPAHVRIVHGDIDSGKTRRVAAWVEAEAAADRVVGGVLAQKTPGGRRFFDLMTGDDIGLEHPTDDETAVEVGRFRFRQAAFDWAVLRIEAAVAAGCEAVVIDEVGPLEMRGEGFADLLDRLVGVKRVLLVRTSMIAAVVDRFAAGADVTFDPPLAM